MVTATKVTHFAFGLNATQRFVKAARTRSDHREVAGRRGKAEQAAKRSSKVISSLEIVLAGERPVLQKVLPLELSRGEPVGETVAPLRGILALR